MIEFEYGFRSYTFNDFRSLDFWNSFFTPEFQSFFLPLKYDIIDHPRKPFPKNEPQEILDFYLENGDLFIQFSRNLLLWVKEFSKKIYNETYYLENSKDKSSLRSLILQNLPISQPFLLCGSTGGEYNKKHKVIELLDDGGSIENAIGVSREDFRHQLPGIYSFTVFGSEIIAFFTRAKLENMKTNFPNLEYFETPGYFGFQIDDKNQSLESVIQTQKEIAKYLGQEYFFDRDLVGQVEFRSIPAFQKRIS
jgi:hypothetical protein